MGTNAQTNISSIFRDKLSLQGSLYSIIIEADISSSVATNTHKKIDEYLRQRIITTCGDADVTWGTKHIDPALCIYVGAYLICIDNKHLKDKVAIGNGTLCKVIGVKFKHNP